MNEPSGRRWREPFARFDPDTSSWRTWQPSLPLENLPELPVTWPRSGTWDLGAAYALPTSVPPMGVCGPSSLLPTPDASMGNGGRQRSREALASGNHQANLNDLPRMLLPTPNASVSQDGEAFETWEARRKVAAEKHGNNGIGMPLTIAVQLLPTPSRTTGTDNRLSE
jgi:hypothetical protein